MCGMEFNTDEEALWHEKAVHGSLTDDQLVARNKLDRVEHSELPDLDAYDKWGEKLPREKIVKFNVGKSIRQRPRR
jgi:hypothetical protein